MSTFTVQIERNNAAFDDGNDGSTETASILRELADKIRHTGVPRPEIPLYDSNGNHVGWAKVTK